MFVYAIIILEFDSTLFIFFCRFRTSPRTLGDERSSAALRDYAVTMKLQLK